MSVQDRIVALGIAAAVAGLTLFAWMAYEARRALNPT